MTAHQARRVRPALNATTLEELALRYVGRFATTRAKFKTYLVRKVRERGWGGEHAPDLDRLAERFTERGYIDDAAYALSKSRALTGRGYGYRRVDQTLRAAGVEEADAVAARDHAEMGSVDAAIRFAQRRRIGPFAAEAADTKVRQRAMAAMIRAGHGFALARQILDLPPGAEVDADELSGERGSSSN